MFVNMYENMCKPQNRVKPETNSSTSSQPRKLKFWGLETNLRGLVIGCLREGFNKFDPRQEIISPKPRDNFPI